jgi:outer membrane protein assembly factor BamB
MTFAGRGSPLAVAVKILKGGGLSAAALAAAAGALEGEAAALAAASDGGVNEHVVDLFGVARGPPTDAWRAHLGAFAAPLLGAAGDRELVGLVMRWEGGGTLATRLHDVYLGPLQGAALAWAFPTADAVTSSPALSPDSATLYIGGLDFTLYALDAALGSAVFNFSAQGAIGAAQETLSAAGGDCCTRVRPLWLLASLRGAALVGGAGLPGGGALPLLSVGAGAPGAAAGEGGCCAPLGGSCSTV